MSLSNQNKYQNCLTSSRTGDIATDLMQITDMKELKIIIHRNWDRRVNGKEDLQRRFDGRAWIGLDATREEKSEK